MDNLIYPGSIVIKRFKHCLFLSTISLTLFINEAQDFLLQTTIELVEETQKFLPQAQSQVKVVESLIPLIEKVEKSRFRNWIIDAGLPTSENIKSNCDAVQTVANVIPNIIPTLKLTAQILKYTTIFLAIQIALSVFWIVADLKKGNQKLLTAMLVFFSILINYRVHDFIYKMNYFT